MKTVETTPNDAGMRLDVWLARCLPECSRSRWQQLIREGRVQVDGEVRKAGCELSGNECISYDIPAPEGVDLQPENIPLNILYEDADIIVIDKAPDMVVHPAAGHNSGTLVNALLYHCCDLKGIGGELRPGIVHRLDRDTSGVMVVAKNQMALNNLAAQFRHRQVHKEYLTIVCGHPNPVEGTIDAPVGRSLHDRKKMSASVHRGRHAVTHYTTIEHYPAHTMLRVRIETGRTHQIRVHMAHRRHPVAGDRQYGGKMAAALPVEVDRQMLHAERLSFFHPRFGEEICFVAPMPEDMRNLIRVLRAAS